jgi:hypothetical protein
MKSLLFGVMALAMSLASVQIAQAQSLDIETALQNAAESVGILRGEDKEDSQMTLEYWGSGTMRELRAGAPPRAFNVPDYYGSIAFDFPGMRVDFIRVGPDGTSERHIQVVSGTFAWDETGEQGGGLVPGFGSALPRADEVNERLLQLWMTPFGVIKAATAAKGSARVSTENGATIITFPLSGPTRTSLSTNVVVGSLAGTPVKLTLNEKNQPARVEVRYGNATIETIYAEYGDLNGADYMADVLFPRRISQRIGGQLVMDLTINKTNTYNPYVIVPVPESVQKGVSR